MKGSYLSLQSSGHTHLLHTLAGGEVVLDGLPVPLQPLGIESRSLTVLLDDAVSHGPGVGHKELLYLTCLLFSHKTRQ